jgi:DNA polymerase I-like protein with 3'-5' exonuclease and polymerase domains
MARTLKNNPSQLSFFALLDDTPLNDNIVLSTSSVAFLALLPEMANAKVLTLDIETTHDKTGQFNGLDHARGRIRLMQIYLSKINKVLVVDLFKTDVGILDKFTQLLGRQLSNPDCVICGQNIYFDLLYLRHAYGFRANNIRDSRIMSQIRWAGIKLYRHGLGDIYKRLFFNTMSKEMQRSDWSQPELSNTQLNYAATDVVNTFRCIVELGKQIQTFNNMRSILGSECDYKLDEIALTECNAIPAFVEIAYNGLPINIPFAANTIEQYKNAINDLYAPVGVKLGLPYSAQPLKIAKSIYQTYGVWLIEEDYKKSLLDPEDDDDDIIKKKDLRQLTLTVDDEYPPIPSTHKLTTASSTLFNYFVETGEEDLLILSLVRSLKKALDSIVNLHDSAVQNNGNAKGGYNVLGMTSTGRSTCGGDRKSSTIAQNLQNLPNEVKHPLLDRYALPAPREVIQAPTGSKLSIIDLSASHSRYIARFSQDPTLLSSFDMVDPHMLMTKDVMNTSLKSDLTVQDLLDRGGKKDKEIANYRTLAKTAYYLCLNVGSANRLYQVFQKDFSDVTKDECEISIKTFATTFPQVVSWQRNLHQRAKKNLVEIQMNTKAGGKYNKKYALFRTQDGRLIHLEAHKKEKKIPNQPPKIVYEPKINDCTSCMLISAEAIAEKKTLAKIMDILPKYPTSCKLISMCHDEINLLISDDSVGREFNHKVYEINSKEFTLSLGDCPSGMHGDSASSLKTLADKYSEK